MHAIWQLLRAAKARTDEHRRKPCWQFVHILTATPTFSLRTCSSNELKIRLWCDAVDNQETQQRINFPAKTSNFWAFFAGYFVVTLTSHTMQHENAVKKRYLPYIYRKADWCTETIPFSALVKTYRLF